MTERSILVPEGLEGQRVDAAMSKLLGLSRTAAADICADGGVQMSGRPVIKSDRVIAGERLDIIMPEPQRPVEVVADPVPGMRIVHDEDAFVVVDKPVGVAAHPAIGWTGRTVVGGLAAAGFRIATSGAPERQGIVQRLDVGTSGLMVVAKSEYAYSVLKRAFKERTVDKTYHALVQGLPDPVLGTIDAPIARHPKHDGLYAVRTGGKNAITHYEVIEAHRRAALVEVHLETGRTHQIRVHFSATKHPCVGDLPYGADPVLAKELGLERQWLHAVKLGFRHPDTQKWVEFESDYPEDLQIAIDHIRPH
ncbi:RluA family pseudouridine synthase [Brevibacterium sp. SMBL_HHYL_HB1]|uniref:RluA family pseudouridine synthase n=1 Tax=Brevibacterium sp. SMBL_HHYL_HB1 TaxID=2777556 RepID=UPI001BAD0F2C|nr:RluA family pseudouridine synthase [Brevibacterium sp. SMBL_HHYL_HB1]QUL80228.1 RluA family pseudouridine synthase [Brevibacterium sp. SMBL_HHYL_HB1]